MVAEGLKRVHASGKPTVSIALCTCNGEKFLEALLASLARQTLLPGELVIGDDASDDGTLPIIHRFAHSAPVRIVPRSERGVMCSPLCVATRAPYEDTDESSARLGESSLNTPA